MSILTKCPKHGQPPTKVTVRHPGSNGKLVELEPLDAIFHVYAGDTISIVYECGCGDLATDEEITLIVAYDGSGNSDDYAECGRCVSDYELCVLLERHDGDCMMRAEKDLADLKKMVGSALTYPRFVSIGSIDNTVEIQISRKAYDQIIAKIYPSKETTDAAR